MAFIKAILSFFRALFPQKTAETKQRAEIRRIENLLRDHNPPVYQKKLVQPLFAEAVFTLYRYSGLVGNILLATVHNPNKQTADYYKTQLLATGFTSKTYGLLKTLEYENLKEEMRGAESRSTVYEIQRQRLESFFEVLATPPFQKIESVLAQLDRFTDICQNNYVTTLKLFDPEFKAGDPKYVPAFHPIPAKELEFFISEFYYLAADFLITDSLANAIIALAKLGRENFDEEPLVSCLKKINSVFKSVLEKETLLQLYRIIKINPRASLTKGEYLNDVISMYCDKLYDAFNTNQQWIQIALADEQLGQNIGALFDQQELLPLQGYNSAVNTLLTGNAQPGFFWIMPLRFLKTFLAVYFDESTRALFECICLEGFFCGLTFKNEFIGLFRICSETGQRIVEFEALFGPEKENYENLIAFYIRDYNKNASKRKKLADIVDTANTQARELIQEEITNFYNFQIRISDMLSDTRKTEANYVTNIKLLLSSPRNRDRRERFERQFSKWSTFIDIMRNYAVLMRNDILYGNG